MKKSFIPALSTLFVTGLAGAGCAGPTTPLGALWTLTPPPVAMPAEPPQFPAAVAHPVPQTTLAQYAANPQRAPASLHPTISFQPPRQILHGRTHLRVMIDDPTSGQPDDYRIVVRYNGADVTQMFLLRAIVNVDPIKKRVTIENPAVRLPPNSNHSIEVFYLSNSGAMAYSHLGEPRCYAFKPRKVLTLGEFDPQSSIVSTIEKVSNKGGVNPAFFTALVAQESSFNIRVVSWARALGLTQITPTAEEDLSTHYTDWPRYPGLNEIPAPVLKAMVLSGEVNGKNEWRLDPARSVQGGVDYTLMLSERWSTPERWAKIRATFSDPEQAHTQLVLASYNSGLARVLNAFDRYGARWLESPDLREARKYVRRITSYCDYFSTGETQPTASAAFPVELFTEEHT